MTTRNDDHPPFDSTGMGPAPDEPDSAGTLTARTPRRAVRTVVSTPIPARRDPAGVVRDETPPDDTRPGGTDADGTDADGTRSGAPGGHHATAGAEPPDAGADAGVPATGRIAGTPAAAAPPVVLGRAGTRIGAPQRARHRRTARRPERRLRRWARRHRVLATLGVIVVLMTPVWWSAANAATNPALGSSLPARMAEWVRGHGGSSVVAWAENVWYSHHPPPVGGTPARGAIPAPVSPHPSTTLSPANTAAAAALAKPPPIVPIASPAVPGEGQWHPVGRTVDGVSAVYEAYLRPDAVHTSVVVGVAWMDPRLLKATLYSGSSIPGGGPWAHTAPVTPTAAQSLVAAFNAGFLMRDARGGYYTQGKTVIPLRTGGASFVIYADGTATVGAWGTNVRMTPNVVSVRQNLSLIVDNGKPVPNLNANDTTVWGATLGNQVYVWRSGVGVTANGALVYVGGPDLNITDLANVLVRAGAVRAMELDINTDWVNYSVYTPASPTAAATPQNGSTLVSTMSGGSARYFASWWTRDFFTMSARSTPLATAGAAGLP